MRRPSTFVRPGKGTPKTTNAGEENSEPVDMVDLLDYIVQTSRAQREESMREIQEKVDALKSQIDSNPDIIPIKEQLAKLVDEDKVFRMNTERILDDIQRAQAGTGPVFKKVDDIQEEITLLRARLDDESKLRRVAEDRVQGFDKTVEDTAAAAKGVSELREKIAQLEKSVVAEAGERQKQAVTAEEKIRGIGKTVEDTAAATKAVSELREKIAQLE